MSRWLRNITFDLRFWIADQLGMISRPAPPEKQRVILIGGPADGRIIEVNAGVKAIAFPVLSDQRILSNDPFMTTASARYSEIRYVMEMPRYRLEQHKEAAAEL